MTELLQTRRVMVAILAVGMVAMAARPMSDPDLWWHLRTGQWILQTHAVPHTDSFSYTRFAQPWVNHEWLSDLSIYAIYRAGGWGGLIVVFGVITAAAFFLAFWRSPGRPYISGLITVLAAVASVGSWGVRPQMISLLLASVLLFLLDRFRSSPKRLWWTPLLILLWVNLHAEFATGIALLLLFLIGDLLDVAFGFEKWEKATSHMKTLTLVTFVSLAAVALNPNGWRMYSYPFETLHSPAMQNYIAEWSSPDFHHARSLPFLVMMLASVVGLVISPRRIRPKDVLLLLVTMAAALRSVRHIAIYTLVAIPMLSAQVHSGLEARKAGRLYPGASRPSTAKAVVNLLLLMSVAVFACVRVRYVVAHQEQTEAENFPAAAVSFLKSQEPPGPILNHYNWGGYLIWKLGGSRRVCIDGRADLYGDQFLDDFASTYYLTGNWEKGLESWQVRTVLLPPNAPLITALRLSPSWKEIYTDAQAAILTRREDTNVRLESR